METIDYAVPTGKYAIECKAAQIRPAKSGSGDVLCLECEWQDGPRMFDLWRCWIWMGYSERGWTHTRATLISLFDAIASPLTTPLERDHADVIANVRALYPQLIGKTIGVKVRRKEPTERDRVYAADRGLDRVYVRNDVVSGGFYTIARHPGPIVSATPRPAYEFADSSYASAPPYPDDDDIPF